MKLELTGCRQFRYRVWEKERPVLSYQKDLAVSGLGGTDMEEIRGVIPGIKFGYLSLKSK